MSAVDVLEFYAVVFVMGAYFGPGLISGLVAWKKGYRPWFWLLSMGIIGMLVTFALPALAKAKTPEEREGMEWRADWSGGILSGVTLFPLVVIVVFQTLFFVRIHTAAIAPTPPAVTSSPAMEDASPMQ